MMKVQASHELQLPSALFSKKIQCCYALEAIFQTWGELPTAACRDELDALVVLHQELAEAADDFAASSGVALDRYRRRLTAN